MRVDNVSSFSFMLFKVIWIICDSVKKIKTYININKTINLNK